MVFSLCGMDAELIVSLLRAFEVEGVAYTIVGGVALNLLGLPRDTQDIDVFVRPDEANVARLRAALHTVFEDPSIDEITAEELAGEYPAIQYVPPSGRFHIDLLARLGDGFAFDDIETEERIIEGIRVQVATPRMLFRMKRDTVRPQDKADAARLASHFDLDGED